MTLREDTRRMEILIVGIIVHMRWNTTSTIGVGMNTEMRHVMNLLVEVDILL
jgi:hypothetical protein